MADVSLETVTGKLNRVGYDAFMQALRHAKNAGNRMRFCLVWTACCSATAIEPAMDFTSSGSNAGSGMSAPGGRDFVS